MERVTDLDTKAEQLFARGLDIEDDQVQGVGDQCLRAARRAFSQAVRRDTAVVARYGGDEMAAVLPYTDLEGAI